MAITGGSLLNSVPATGQLTLSTNYLDLAILSFKASALPCS